MKVLLSIIILLLLASCEPAYADRPTDWYVKACSILGTPSSVTVDVYDDDAPGSVLATILNADVNRYGTTDCYQVNLRTTSAAISFPPVGSAADTSYTLMWKDDAFSDIVTNEVVVGYPGAHRMDESCEEEHAEYSAVAIPSRGLTASMIAAGRPSYFTVKISCSKNFAAPDFTYYKIMYYDGSGRVDYRTPSDTPPSP
jgi:hypothetical protein